MTEYNPDIRLPDVDINPEHLSASLSYLQVELSVFNHVKVIVLCGIQQRKRTTRLSEIRPEEPVFS
ncbi:MAG: hypothetical protein ACI32N_09530 [Bulleidia sp.]